MDEKNKPLFLTEAPNAATDCQAKNMENGLAKPEEMSWGDYMLKDKAVMSPRHRELARMLAQGAKNKDICEALGYTPGRVSVLKSNSRIKQEVERLQDRIFEEDIDKRLKFLATDAVNALEKILLDPDIEPIKKESAARWMLEKVSGKPAQAIDLKGEISVGIFMDQIESMVQSGQIIDVNGGPAVAGEHSQVPQGALPEVVDKTTTADPMADWIKANI